jgi:hypothetical protein
LNLRKTSKEFQNSFLVSIEALRATISSQRPAVPFVPDTFVSSFVSSATQWNPTINQHIDWVRDQFLTAPDSAALFNILRSYRRSFTENGRYFTHGTPNDVREWVFPEDVYDPQKLNRIAKQFASNNLRQSRLC